MEAEVKGIDTVSPLAGELNGAVECSVSSQETVHCSAVIPKETLQSSAQNGAVECRANKEIPLIPANNTYVETQNSNFQLSIPGSEPTEKDERSFFSKRSGATT